MLRMNPDERGLAVCSRYAFAPNLYHYCGPEKQSDLQAYVSQNIVDGGLSDILSHFDTLYKYLVLIASENAIDDPFDPRVVEAYWLGNSLALKVQKGALMNHITDGLSIGKKMPKSAFSKLSDSLMSHGLPTHTDHVLSVYIRTGHHAIVHTLETMDNCRISWGRVKEKLVNRTGADQCIIEMRHLSCVNDALTLGPPELTTVLSVGIVPKVGDWVSVHWGYICDVLSESQVKQVSLFTNRALQFAKGSV